VSKKDIGALRARVIAVFSILLLAVVPIMVSARAKRNSRSA
jgi:type II secretory pathway pseudopilin PulG